MQQERPGVGYPGGRKRRFGFRDRQVRQVNRGDSCGGSRVEVRQAPVTGEKSQV